MGVFQKFFGKYLLLTNTVSCGLMMGFGDVLQQRNEHWKRHNKEDSSISQNGKLPKPDSRAKKEDEKPLIIADIINDSDKEYAHDYLRTRNMFIIGFVQGPFQHYFYATLDRTLPGKDTITILKKTMLDQLIASPTCLAMFFFGLGGLEHKRMKDINDEVKLKFVDTLKVDWCFWPPVQWINFLLLPIRYRVLYVNLMTMIYNIFLSYMKYDAQYD